MRFNDFGKGGLIHELASFVVFPLWFFQLKNKVALKIRVLGGGILGAVLISELLYQDQILAKGFSLEYGFVYGLFLVLMSRFAVESALNRRRIPLIILAYVIVLLPLLVTPSVLSYLSGKVEFSGLFLLSVASKFAYYIWLIHIGLLGMKEGIGKKEAAFE